MDDQITEPSLAEIPFKAFETDFAKRICRIAGAQKLSELQNSQITFRCKDFGTITAVMNIEHAKEHLGAPEYVILYLRSSNKVLNEIRLYNSYFIKDKEDIYPSGLYTAFKSKNNHSFEYGQVGVGPHDRLLVTSDGHIADTKGVT